MESCPKSLPPNILKLAKAVSALSADDKDSCIDDIENEITSILSIYSEESHEVPVSEYEGTSIDSWPFASVIHKILEINLFTRESTPYTLVLQENEEKVSERPLRFIPLLRLRVFFPFSYPKVTPPAYYFVSNWLAPKYLAQLQSTLNSMWSAGTPIVFEWADYIQNEYLGTLDFAAGRRIQLPRGKNYHDMVEYLLFFDTEKDKQEFNNSEVQCEVCLRAISGSNFVRLPACKHYICKDCFKTYAESLIMEGKVSQLCCFAEGCKKMLSDTLLKETLPEDLYDKYETFSVNKALETMEDIAWCPKCEGPAFKDSAKAIVAHCTACDYRFCLKCGERFHPFQRCKALEISREIATNELKKASGSNKSMSATLTNIYIKKFTKPCPNCTAPIIKSGGCNKVGCSKCGKSFCWLCLKCISDYGHFGEMCVLFTSESLKEQEVTDITDMINGLKDEEFSGAIEEAKLVPSACPKCACINLKTNRLNLIKCDSCAVSYCFFCGQEADEDHFKESQCLKYS